MQAQSPQALTKKKCQPCEGGVDPVSASAAAEQVAALPGWKLSSDGKMIRKEWRLKDFSASIEFFQRVANVANAEDHHPDLHLTGYRNVAIELTTHAIKGLSENDFILAAKIDELPVELKSK